MNRLLLPLFLVLFASVGHAEDDPFAELKKGQPKDVAALVERIAICTHLGGEEPYDDERARELAETGKQYRCGRLDADEAALNKRHKGNAAVKKALQKAHDW
ncbi:hypothetical protein [Pseudoduganella violaceinigra]|uniref:hypothetical protein n=1 Tax=Pseudoduganella violaceinigra TaxID=246602 RepID=UPI0012B586DD|nr:hypothetical protein [Pseudoduganella violaceinigra]